MSRIDPTFAKLQAEGRKALIPYVTAGFPFANITPDLMHGMVLAGADVIELGIPFSDPMADGLVIQKAGDRALALGIGLAQVLEIVKTFRLKNDATPVVLMGYANPIEAMGVARFADRAQASAVPLTLATAPIATTKMVEEVFRNYMPGGDGLTFAKGLSPFAAVCKGHDGIVQVHSLADPTLVMDAAARVPMEMVDNRKALEEMCKVARKAVFITSADESQHRGPEQEAIEKFNVAQKYIGQPKISDLIELGFDTRVEHLERKQIIAWKFL